MKVFVDTADIDEIEEAFSWGIIDGVTTNPSLIKKAVDKVKGTSMESYIEKILETAGPGCPVSLEVIGLTEKEMCEEAIKLYRRFNLVEKNVVIKIPVNPATDAASETRYDGLKAIRNLSSGPTCIPVNCTLIMTPEQALLAAKAGARYVSPFAGRIDDYLRKKYDISFNKEDYFPADGHNNNYGQIINDNGIVSGVDLVEKTVKILKNYNLETKVIAASLRNARQVREVALAGAHIATIPFKVLEDMLCHEKTYEGVKKFAEDVVPEYAALFE